VEARWRLSEVYFKADADNGYDLMPVGRICIATDVKCVKAVNAVSHSVLRSSVRTLLLCQIKVMKLNCYESPILWLHLIRPPINEGRKVQPKPHNETGIRGSSSMEMDSFALSWNEVRNHHVLS